MLSLCAALCHFAEEMAAERPTVLAVVAGTGGVVAGEVGGRDAAECAGGGGGCGAA